MRRWKTNSNNTSGQPINFKCLKSNLLLRCKSLLEEWLPDGRLEGREYVARNPKRQDQSLGSFKINLQTGKWADFAVGEYGGDLISLYAYLNDVSQYQAAKVLNQMQRGGVQ